MSGDPDTSQFQAFDELADEFVARYRRNERPTVQEYVDRCPKMEAAIRELFPALVEVEVAERIISDGDSPAAADDAGRAEPVAPLIPLDRIGDFQIIREIGRGGMGIVYEAEQLSLARRVALKVLPWSLSRDATALLRFRREARSAARLHHTNIVPVFEVGEDGDVVYYTMQYIPGQGLDLVVAELKRLRDESRRTSRPHRHAAAAPAGADPGDLAGPKQAMSPCGPDQSTRVVVRAMLSGQFTAANTTLIRPPTPLDQAAAVSDPLEGAVAHLPLGASSLPGGSSISAIDSSAGHQPFFRAVAEIGRQAASALAYAHERGIVHRDIKPANLLLDAAGVVWVADFGLATNGDDGLTATGDILGTVRYMAPERLRGEGDARADLYALGITLYELLTLRPAFESGDRLRLVQQVRDQDPPRPRSVDPRIPRDLETVILKAIEKDPRRRYASAAALGDDLRRFLAGEPIRARQVGEFERLWKWACRRPGVAGLVGLAITSLVAGTAVATSFALVAGRRAEDARRAEGRERDRMQEARAAQGRAVLERDNSRRLSAGLTVDKGLALAEGGQPEVGVHWLLEGLRSAPDAGGDFGRMVRHNLAGWLDQVHEPVWIRSEELGQRHGFYPVVSFDGRSFVAFEMPSANAAAVLTHRETATGRVLGTFPGAWFPVGFRPDGKVIVTGWSSENRLRAFEVATGRELWTSDPVGAEAYNLYFRADGTKFDLFTRVPEEWSADGMRLGRVQAWDAAVGRPAGPLLKGRHVVTKDSRPYVLSEAADRSHVVSVWDQATGTQHEIYRSSRVRFENVAGDLGGQTLAINTATPGGISSLWFFDQATRRPIGPALGRSHLAELLPAGDRALVQGDGAAGRPLHLRDVASGRALGSSFREAGNVFACVVMPDGRHVLLKSSHGVTMFCRLAADPTPATSGQMATAIAPGEDAPGARRRDVGQLLPRLSPGGELALRSVSGSATAIVQLFDPNDGRPVGDPARLRFSGVRSMLFSPDGRRFATGSHPNGLAGEARVWDAATGRPVTPPLPHTNYVSAVAFSPDGRILAAGDYHGLVRLWDAATGEAIGKPLPQGSIVWALAFSPDGRVLAVGHHFEHSNRPGVQRWDVATGRAIGALLPTSAAVTGLTFRPDGRVLAAEDGDTIYLWDTSGEQGAPICDRLADEMEATFSPDGRTFITRGKAGLIRQHDATTGALLTTLYSGPVPATCLAFDAGGRTIIAGFNDGTVRLIDPATARPIGPPRWLELPIATVAFRADGRHFVAINEAGESGTWEVPGAIEAEDLAALTWHVETRTGYRLSPGPAVVPLGAQEWASRLERLGPPPSSSADDPACHDQAARMARWRGQFVAARWHLDRLITARPGDWTLHARRAEIYAAAGDLAAAAAEYECADGLAPPAAVIAWQRHRAAQALQAGDLVEALWYLDRLVAIQPEDWTLLDDRSIVHDRLDHGRERDDDRARVLALGGGEPERVLSEAERLARAGRWREAATLLGQCARRCPDDRDLIPAWTVATLFAGDRAGYRESRAAVLAQLQRVLQTLPSLVTLSSWLVLSAGDDTASLVARLESIRASLPPDQEEPRRVLTTLLAMLRLRSGADLDVVLGLFDAGIAVADLNPGGLSLLSLAWARKRDAARAQAYLDRASVAPSRDEPGSFWPDRHEQWLRREAERTLLDLAFPAEPFAR